MYGLASTSNSQLSFGHSSHDVRLRFTRFRATHRRTNVRNSRQAHPNTMHYSLKTCRTSNTRHLSPRTHRTRKRRQTTPRTTLGTQLTRALNPKTTARHSSLNASRTRTRRHTARCSRPVRPWTVRPLERRQAVQRQHVSLAAPSSSEVRCCYVAMFSLS